MALNLIGRALSYLLDEEHWVALMGDLAEERARRSHADGPHQLRDGTGPRSADHWRQQFVYESLRLPGPPRGASPSVRTCSWP